MKILGYSALAAATFFACAPPPSDTKEVAILTDYFVSAVDTTWSDECRFEGTWHKRALIRNTSRANDRPFSCDYTSSKPKKAHYNMGAGRGDRFTIDTYCWNGGGSDEQACYRERIDSGNFYYRRQGSDDSPLDERMVVNFICTDGSGCGGPSEPVRGFCGGDH